VNNLAADDEDDDDDEGEVMSASGVRWSGMLLIVRGYFSWGTVEPLEKVDEIAIDLCRE